MRRTRSKFSVFKNSETSITGSSRTFAFSNIISPVFFLFHVLHHPFAFLLSFMRRKSVSSTLGFLLDLFMFFKSLLFFGCYSSLYLLIGFGLTFTMLAKISFLGSFCTWNILG